MSELDQIISDLENEISRLEAGKKPGNLNREGIYSLEQRAREAKHRKYRLSGDEMIRAASMAPVFQEQIKRLEPGEVSDLLSKARAEKDVVMLHLLSVYAPIEDTRIAAEELGPDYEALDKIAKARELAARLRYLEQLSQYEREVLAESLGYQTLRKPQEQQQASTREIDAQLEQLRHDVGNYF